MKSKNSRPAVMPARKAPAQTMSIDGANYRLVPDPPSGKAADVPFTPVTLNGKTYKLCFEMDQLCDAEVALMRQGHDVNLLRCLGNFSLLGVRNMFAAAVWYFHPEISYREACDLVTLPNGIVIGAVIAQAFTKDLPDPEPAPETSGEAA